MPPRRIRVVEFVRVLRRKGMKFGHAVDKAGKRWRGFFSNRTAEQIRQTAHLGSVGLCRCCGTRVYEGWECENDHKDLCLGCIRLPAAEKIFMVDDVSNDEWESIVKEFYRNARFTHQRRDEGANRPGS